MKNKVILHLPHSSLKLTKEFKQQPKLLNNEEIFNFNLNMTDLFTSEIFSAKSFAHIKAKYSRICIDVEKFADDNKEEMAKFGMGVIYTKTNFKKNFLEEDENYKAKILQKYYHPYHQKLDKKVNKYLSKNYNVIFVDCHSFSKEIIMTNRQKNLPDFCIGINQSQNNLANFVCKYLNNLGYSTAINYPYSGAIIPNNLIKNKLNNFNSIMIEINKNLYLKNNKKK